MLTPPCVSFFLGGAFVAGVTAPVNCVARASDATDPGRFVTTPARLIEMFQKFYHDSANFAPLVGLRS